jgi:t-SNARE complex subunit (syntaxin)
MKIKLEKIEEASDRALNKLENLEQKLKNLDADTKQNKIIIWVIAFIIAAIIIALKS